MNRYEGQLKRVEYHTKTSTKKGEKIKKCLDIMTFDIEVTSAWLYNGKLIAYEADKSADYWNSLEKYALPYVWQFSFNDQVYYGRELQGFKELLMDIPKDIHCICFIHNAAYEYEFLINILTVQNIFARAPHKPFKFSFKECPNIEFRCSYLLTNMSLAQWGDQLKLPKLVGELEYNYMRTPMIYNKETQEIIGTPLFDYELDYCERDCEVVYQGILDHLKTYKDVWDLPLTSTGKVRRVIKKRVTNDTGYMKSVKRTIPKNHVEYARLQRVFQGGYTHANRKYLDETIRGVIHHVDIASSYPTILACYAMPSNKWSYIGRQLPDMNTFDEWAYIIKLHFTNIRCISWNTFIPSFKTSGSGYIYDNGKVLAADELRYECTEQDLITIINNYEWDELEVEGCWKCRKKLLPKIFVEYVLELYNNKTKYKNYPDGSPEATTYAISKQYANSLFGMCVTALFQSEVEFNFGAEYEWNVEELDPGKIDEGLERLRTWYNKKYFLNYSWGVWVPAIARRRLASLIEYTDKDMIYSDTDSLFYLGDYDFTWFNDDITDRLRKACEHHDLDFRLTHPADKDGVEHPLGILECEKDSVSFRTLGAKKYCEEREVVDKNTGEKKNKLFLTVAGINKGSVECLKGNIENFKDGFTFDKDHPSVKKLEHTYLNNMKPITWPGGYYSEFTHGINMRPTGYELSKPDVLKTALNVMETGRLTFTEYFLSKRRGRFRKNET